MILGGGRSLMSEVPLCLACKKTLARGKAGRRIFRLLPTVWLNTRFGQPSGTKSRARMGRIRPVLLSCGRLFPVLVSKGITCSVGWLSHPSFESFVVHMFTKINLEVFELRKRSVTSKECTYSTAQYMQAQN